MLAHDEHIQYDRFIMCTVQTQQCTNSWGTTTEWLWTHTLTLSLSLSGGPCVNDCFSFSKSATRRPLKRFIILFSSVSCYWYTLDFSAPLIPCSSQIKWNNSVWWEQTKSCLRTSPTKSTWSNHLFKSINKRAWARSWFSVLLPILREKRDKPTGPCISSGSHCIRAEFWCDPWRSLPAHL